MYAWHPLAPDWYKQHRRKVLGAAGVAAVVYVAYLGYQSSAAARTKKYFLEFSKTVADLSAACTSLAQCASLVASDLHTFLRSDSDEVPNSLAQVSKLLQSPQLQGAVQTTTASMARGIKEGVIPAADSGAIVEDGPSALDKVLDAILSDRGRSLIGMAVGIAAKNATTAACEALMSGGSNNSDEHGESVEGSGGGGGQRQSSSFGPTELLAMLTSPEGERLLSLLVTQSMRTAVVAYCEAYAGVNMYEDMLKAISTPAHRDAVTSILSRLTAAFVKEASAAYRQSQRSSTSAPAVHVSSGDSSPASTVVYAEGEDIDSSDRTADSISSGGPGACGPARTMAVAPAGRNARGTQSGADNNGSRNECGSSGAMGWVSLAATLARERDLRHLAVDIACATTREATHEALSTLMSFGHSSHGGVVVEEEDGSNSMGGGGTAAAGGRGNRLAVVKHTWGSQLPMFRMYVVMSMMVSLGMYAVSPRTLVV